MRFSLVHKREYLPVSRAGPVRILVFLTRPHNKTQAGGQRVADDAVDGKRLAWPSKLERKQGIIAVSIYVAGAYSRAVPGLERLYGSPKTIQPIERSSRAFEERAIIRDVDAESLVSVQAEEAGAICGERVVRGAD